MRLTAHTVLVALLAACNGDDTDTSDTDPGTSSSDACDELDCSDPNCAAEPECAWPDAMTQDSRIDFVGRQITCDLGGFDFPYDVPDCTTAFTVNMTERTEGNLCTACDATYAGDISYSQDSCSELLGTQAPTSGEWGFVALSATERELWLYANGTWAYSSTLTLQDGVYSYTITEAIHQDPDECNNGEQYVGDLTATVNFADE